MKKNKMKKCFSPYRKYVVSALAFPLFIIGLFSYMSLFDNITFRVPIMLFSMFLILPVLMVLPNLVKCPKCEQKIACKKEDCLDLFGFTSLKALFSTKCKKCGHDLGLCEDGE
jgi:hypothetical protein